MNLDANSMRVQSLVLHHDVADPLQVELRGGLPGQNGREISVLGRGAMGEWDRMVTERSPSNITVH